MNQKEFLPQHLTEDRSYQYFEKEHGLDRKQLQEWYATGGEDLETIREANQKYSAKHKLESFKFGKREFAEWYLEQKRSCHYCGIDESKLKVLFDYETGVLATKRGRGRALELERRDAKGNDYSAENCVLACYLCNNHKSDLISEEDHRQYFAPSIKKYLEDKFTSYQRNNNEE